MGSSAGWLGEKERGREKARDMSFWTERVASRRESSVASYTGRLGLYMAVVYIYISLPPCFPRWAVGQTPLTAVNRPLASLPFAIL